MTIAMEGKEMLALDIESKKTRQLLRFMSLFLIHVMGCNNLTPGSAPVSVGDSESVPRTGAGAVIVHGIGHGVFYDSHGKQVAIDQDTIRSTQEHLIALVQGGHERAWREQRVLIFDAVRDPIVANALYLDVLLSGLDRDDEGRIAMVNNALRWHYLNEILHQPAPRIGDRWTRGVPGDATGRLAEGGISIATPIGSGGEEYREACLAAGVPVPDTVFGSSWVNRGEVINEFIDSGQTILHSFQSDDPAGVCLALPRYSSPSDGTANLLGVICLGTQSSKACFWDNPKGTGFARDVEVSLSEFVGGVDLVANGQGECTDCHAGENPFVVHPEKEPFASLLSEVSLMPLAWHDPLVDASWVQNPGPTTVLDAVVSTGQCNGCHRAGGPGGRFPAMSTPDLAGYCGTVLDNAVRDLPPSDEGTMPPYGADQSLFSAHITALQALCNTPSTTGEIVETGDTADDPGFVSPPVVIEPLYQCAEQVAVLGAQLDAEVSVYVNGSHIDTRIARSPTQVVFDVPSLAAGDVVEADQVVDGVASAMSPAAIVRDHLVDYPAGLPAPDIGPTIVHECASTIAVFHVPGAKLTVYTNGSDPSTRGTSTDYSVAYPANAPFNMGDELTAEIELCGDRSPVSAPVYAVAAPATMPAPTFDPPETFAGQELITLSTLVHGATTTVSEISAGTLGSTGSWPVTWYPDFDVAQGLGRPLVAGDQLEAYQELCEMGPSNVTPEAKDCEELPPPRIATPIAGQTWVSVTESVPGAQIRVYDSSLDELGDGAGTVVLLKRALMAGDVLLVVQQVGDCTGRLGYLIEVVQGG